MAELRDDEVKIVKLSGRLVISEAKQARQQIFELIDSGTRKIIVDLGDVNFMDSTGLSVLASAFKAMQQKNGKLVIADVTPPVQSLFELTRLHQVLKIYSSTESALEALRDPVES